MQTVRFRQFVIEIYRGTHRLQPVSAIPNTSLFLEILDMISTHWRLFETCLDMVTKSEFGPVAPVQKR